MRGRRTDLVFTVRWKVFFPYFCTVNLQTLKTSNGPAYTHIYTHTLAPDSSNRTTLMFSANHSSSFLPLQDSEIIVYCQPVAMSLLTRVTIFANPSDYLCQHQSMLHQPVAMSLLTRMTIYLKRSTGGVFSVRPSRLE